MQHPEFSHKTYFSENALLPGLVRGEFNDERAIMAYLDDLKYVDGVRLFALFFRAFSSLTILSSAGRRRRSTQTRSRSLG